MRWCLLSYVVNVVISSIVVMVCCFGIYDECSMLNSLLLKFWSCW